MLLLLLVACKGGKDDDSNGGSDLVENVTAELTDVGTVVRVTFDTTEVLTATVKFGPEGLLYETPATEKGTHHEVLLVGLPALTEAHYQIVVGGEEDTERTIETGTVDPIFQQLTVEGEGHDRFAGVTMLGGELAGVALLDPEGRYVWNHISQRPAPQLPYRMRLLRDGSGVVFNVGDLSGELTKGGGLVKVAFDGLEETFVPLDYLAHDFVELEDGTLAGIAFKEGPIPKECPEVYEKLKPPKTQLLGNHIVEIAPDGTQTEVWDSWDCFDPCVDFSDGLEETPREPGWTFTNALDYDEDSDSYLVSMRSLSTIASISRATGECNWTFGSAASATTVPVGQVFHHEHQFQYWPGHMLVFDNEGGGFTSRVLEYAFDPKEPTAEVIWSHDTDVFSPVLGDVQRLENGDTMFIASLAGQIERVTSTGESVWKANTGIGSVFGFGAHYTSPYEPTSAPD